MMSNDKIDDMDDKIVFYKWKGIDLFRFVDLI